MNRTPLAVAALTKKSVNDKIQFGGVIVDALTAHSDVFKDPSPSIARIQEVTQELRDANDEAGTGLNVGKQRLKKAVLAFDEAIGLYQVYVNLIAQGDGVIIEQSGLQVSRPAQKSGPMPAPSNLQLNGSVARQISTSVEPVYKAKAYLWEYYEGDVPLADAKLWRLACGTSTAKATIANLPSKTTIWVRCAAIGPKGQGPWSAPISDNVR